MREFRNRPDSGYNFLLYQPENLQDTAEALPLIIFLHGRSLSGNNLSKVRRYGVLEAIERKKISLKSMILAPQCPASEHWNPDKVKNVLEYVRSKFTYDTNRVYVVGMSLGGYGTLDFVGKYPEYVSAAVAMCGGGNPVYAKNLSGVPLWIMHGRADRAVHHSESEKIIDAIKASGYSSLLRYDFYDYMGHGALARTFYSPDLYSWLFQFSKTNVADSLISRYSFSPEYFGLRKPVSPARPDSADTAITTAKKASETPAKIHIVKKGDTLYAISRKYNTTIEALCKLNGIKEESVLQLGQRIKVK